MIGTNLLSLERFAREKFRNVTIYSGTIGEIKEKYDSFAPAVILRDHAGIPETERVCVLSFLAKFVRPGKKRETVASYNLLVSESGQVRHDFRSLVECNAPAAVVLDACKDIVKVENYMWRYLYGAQQAVFEKKINELKEEQTSLLEQQNVVLAGLASAVQANITLNQTIVQEKAR